MEQLLDSEPEVKPIELTPKKLIKKPDFNKILDSRSDRRPRRRESQENDKNPYSNFVNDSEEIIMMGKLSPKPQPMIVK